MIIEIAFGIVLAVVILATARFWLPLLSGAVLFVIILAALLMGWAFLT